MASRTQPLRWRTLQDVADVLLTSTTTPDGHTLAEAMARIQRHRDRETEIFTATTDGSAKDRQTYDHNLAEFDRLPPFLRVAHHSCPEQDNLTPRYVMGTGPRIPVLGVKSSRSRLSRPAVLSGPLANVGVTSHRVV